jgi:lipoate-protein ligase A
MEIELIQEEKTLDPELNLGRDAEYWKQGEANRARVWRNGSCLVMGRFLKPEAEVYLDKAEELGIPVLKRASGGGAVYHDPGNLNYSLYLDLQDPRLQDIGESLRALSFPVTRLLDLLEVPWKWVPPNNIYVEGKKISGSAQARSRGRLLHHGTLLVSCDLEMMKTLLRPGGRSTIAPVINLAEVLPGVTVEEVGGMLSKEVRRG